MDQPVHRHGPPPLRRKAFDGVRYPVGLLHEDYYVLPDLIAHCSAVYCMAFTGYYVLRHTGSITDGARHEVRSGHDERRHPPRRIFLAHGWYDRAEGALTDAALFFTRQQVRLRFAKSPATARNLPRQKMSFAACTMRWPPKRGSASMKLRAAALRAGLGVFAMYVSGG